MNSRPGYSTGSHGHDRLDRIQAVLRSQGIDALVCTLPSNVLLVSGYWPVVGASVAVATKNGIVSVMAPEDERDLTQPGWAARVAAYSPGSLTRQMDTVEAIVLPLQELLNEMGLARGCLAYESTPLYEGSSYSATFRFQDKVADLLARTAPDAALVAGDAVFERLRFSLTPFEVDRVRLACQLAAPAFAAARAAVTAGMRESEVAGEYSRCFEVAALNHAGVSRAGAFARCMSGPNSAKAGGAFARSTGRKIETGDLVLLHCNPYVDGYFGDVTRTYIVGKASERIDAMYDAVFAAREAAFALLRPGTRCADVDAAARSVLTDRGFSAGFTHGVGHSVGFSVISAEFPPRLNPTSPDVLEVGCTVNIEPAIYIEGFGGIRHCDVVTITETGFELLTDFDSDQADLALD